MADYKDMCIVDETIPIHQLNKINEKGNKRFDIFPLSIVQAIFDKTGIRLDTIISSFNYIFLPYKGTKEDTRLQVVSLMRRKSLVICYRDLNDKITIEMYNSNDRGDNAWKSDENWVNWEDWLIQIIKDIFGDINNYPDLEQIIKELLDQYLTDNFNDYVKNFVDEYLADLDLNPIINNYLQQYINEHPDLINNIVNKYLETNLEPLVGQFFNKIVEYLRDNERVIANALARHEQAITELQNK